MRILLTTDTIGGVWTFTRELSTELLRRGHAVALISFGRGASEPQEAWARGTVQRFPGAFRYEFTHIPLEWMTGNDGVYEEGAAVLSRLIAEFRPDLLHSNQFCYGALPTRVPKLVTAHGDILSWAAVCRPDGFERSTWLERCIGLIQTGLGGADAISAPTDWMAAELRRHWTFGPEPQAILNGCTLPAASQAPHRKLQAVSAGRLWDEAKNTSLLLNVGFPLPVFLAGEGKLGDAEAELTADHITLLGALPEDELLALFRQSSLYLATSRYEPFGLAPLEAALCGCALLANDIPSFREIWGNAALYFQDGHSLEVLLRELVSDAPRLEAARQRSLTRALELTASHMTDKYLALYQRLTCAHSSRVAVMPEVPAAHVV